MEDNEPEPEPTMYSEEELSKNLAFNFTISTITDTSLQFEVNFVNQGWVSIHESDKLEIIFTNA